MIMQLFRQFVFLFLYLCRAYCLFLLERSLVPTYISTEYAVSGPYVIITSIFGSIFCYYTHLDKVLLLAFKFSLSTFSASVENVA